MINDKKFQVDDPGVVGGGSLPNHLFVSVDCDSIPSDDLGQQLYWLQKLNPGIVRFRQVDISRMNDTTKVAMIASIQQALGIKPLADFIR